MCGVRDKFRLLALMSTLAWLVAIAGCMPDSDSPLPAPTSRYLHVSPTGSTQNDGSAARPLYYPNGAINKAFREGYAGVKLARGDYDGILAEEDFRLYGGLDITGGCDPETWEPVPGAVSRIYAPTNPVLAVGIKIPTVIRNLEIVGVAPSYNRPSSSVLSLNNCGPELRFESCRFFARPAYAWPDTAQSGYPAAQTGTAYPGANGDCDSVQPVPGGISSSQGCDGGDGGDGGAPGEPGQDGGRACWPAQEKVAGGAPGQDGEDGLPGADGNPGAHGQATNSLGHLIDGNLQPVGSSHASDGNWGGGGSGGGGGGGSATATGNGGGSGGNGGIGGGGGWSGRHGGHSITVIAVNSTALFVACHLESAAAGTGQTGGNGGPGSSGSPGAPGGDGCPGELGRGGHGGNGGNGGPGGGGAGGNGGLSCCLLVLGTQQPVLDSATTLRVGTGGAAGLGGWRGNTFDQAPSGTPGEAVAVKNASPTSLAGSVNGP